MSHRYKVSEYVLAIQLEQIKRFGSIVYQKKDDE